MERMWKTQIIWKKIGITAGVYLGMKYLVPLLVPFFLAALLVCWCWPALKWLQRRFHIKPAFSMGLLLLAMSALLAAGGVWLGKGLGGLFRWAAERLSSPGEAKRLLDECCESIGGLMQLETEDSWAAALLVTGVAVLLTAADFEKIRAVGRSWPAYERLASVIRGILRSVGGYLRAQCIIMGVIMLLCVAGLWISGVSANPLLAGIGVGALDALPVFGTGTVFLPWILILVFFQKNYTAALILAATYGICILTRELLEPKLIGGRLGILPVVILASVYAGVKLYGFGGILLGPLSVLLIKELWRQVDAAAEKELERAREL